MVEMSEYKSDFINLLLKANALKLGEFTIKSNRTAPYFINFGEFNSGESTSLLSKAYAKEIESRFKDVDNIVLYGIPEKGVGFVPSISAALHNEYKVKSNWFFTRKESKNHGESTNLSPSEFAKGKIVGFFPTKESKIILIDDVFTTGTAKYQALDDLRRLIDNPNVIGLIIAVDRQETGPEGINGIEEFTSKTKIPVFSIINSMDIIEELEKDPNQDKSKLENIRDYLSVYGTKEAKEATRPSFLT